MTVRGFNGLFCPGLDLTNLFPIFVSAKLLVEARLF